MAVPAIRTRASVIDRWRGTLTILVSVAVWSVPAVAQANMGTPLMWAGMLHMFIGNACIGLLEGGILATVFKVRSSRAIPIMVLANYFSAWIGWLWLIPEFTNRIEFDLYNTWGWLWKMTAVAYALTVVFEWPFVAACLYRTPRWLKRSLPACLLTQTVSYLLIFAWYGMASGTSLYTRMSVVPLEEMSLPDDVLVYYLGDRDGDVYCCDLCTRKIDKIRDIHSTSDEDCISVNGTLAGPWNVTAYFASTGDDRDVVIVPDLDDSIVPHYLPEQSNRRRGASWWNFGDVPRLGDDGASAWRFRSGFWPIEGLHGENPESGAQIAFSLETPFVSWPVRNATQLPNVEVVFQLGTRQICIVDPETKTLAILSFGRGPVAVLKPAKSVASQ